MKISFIQRFRFIHNEFIEKCGGDKAEVSLTFRKECLMETGYQIDEKIKAKDGKCTQIYSEAWITFFSWHLELGDMGFD